MTSWAGCNARVISVPFLFLADSSNELTRVSIDLVAVATDADYKQWKVCDGWLWIHRLVIKRSERCSDVDDSYQKKTRWDPASAMQFGL